MKKLLLNVLAVAATLLTACGQTTTPSSPTSSEPQEIGYEYGDKEMFEKVWETKVVHNESCVMIEDSNGVRSARLLYAPTRIIAVKNFTLTKDYDPSEYYVEGDRIYMTSTSTMPYLTQANIACETIPEVIGGSYDDGKGGKILFTEGVGIVYHQIMVTYEHEDTWKGTIPEKQGTRLPNLRFKLENKQPIKFVCNGDSIFTGANSSGKLGIEPFVPGFPEGFTSELNRVYGSEVTLINTAKGGELSNWGKMNVVANVNQYNPDLVLIGFGMNDGSWNVSSYDYCDNIDYMIRSIKHNCPNAEIIVAATIIANPASAQNKGQADYLDPLREVVNTYEGVALLDMTTFSKDLLNIKTSFDLYANNINHPCDFMCRQYVANLMHLVEE